MADYKEKNEIQNDIIAEILRQDVTIATEVGQPLRRIIIDPVSAVLESAYRQDYRTRLAQRLENLYGEELDNFIYNFGMKRRKAMRAAGLLKLSRATVSDANYIIPYNARFATSDGKYFRTTHQALLQIGETYVTAGIEAESPGSAGNVGPDEVILIITGITGITQVTNENACSGGADAETDEEVKSRFVDEVLSNICGTRDFYVGLPLENTNVSKSTVVTPCETETEFIQFEIINTSPAASGGVLSHDQVYDGSAYVENENQSDFYTEHTDWEKQDAIAETDWKDWIEIVLGGNLSFATSAGLPYVWATYDFMPGMSRGIGTVDVFITGQDLQTVADVFKFQTGVDKYYFTKRPVSSIESVIDSTVDIYQEGVDFQLGRDVSNYGRSPSGADYIEWLGVDTPANGELFTVTYIYNALPETIQNSFKDQKPVCTNVLVHEGIPVALSFEMNIMLVASLTQSTYNKQTVDANIEDKLQEWIAALPYGINIQFSDIEYIVHGVAGVDNVKVISVTATPETGFGSPVTYYNDFKIELNQYLTYGNLVTYLKSASTWS